MTDSRAQRLSMELSLRADALALDLFPAARRNGNYWSVGSTAGEPGKSLYIVRHGARAGHWTDAATGEHGDMLDLIRAVRGGTIRDALDWADSWLGNALVWPRKSRPNRPAFTPTPEFTGEDAHRALVANEIWRASAPIAGTIAEAYMRLARDITYPLPASLRCHPGLDYWQDGKKLGRWPVLIGAVQAPDRTITAVHRIWLNGPAKAPVENPKRALGSLGRGAIRLAYPGRVLGLAEGIETALAAMQLFSLPVWSVVAAGRMASVALPPEVEHVIIFADHDPKDERATLEHVSKDGEVVSRPNPMFGKRPGEEAAKRAADVFTAAGLQVDINPPDNEGDDWNDVLRQQARRAA